MHTPDYLIHPKWIITCEENNQVLENHVLAIQGDKITAILPYDSAQIHFPNVSVKTYAQHAVLPGFINCHTHAAMNLFRGLADDLELMQWLKEYIWPAENKWVSDTLVYDGSLLAIAEMIRSGTTCFNDMYFFPEEIARAAESAGIRAFVGMTIMNLPTPWASNTQEYFDKSLAFYEKYKNNSLISPIFAPHSTYTVDRESLIRVKTLAKDLNLKINIHLQEAPSEINDFYARFKKRPIELLNEIDFIDKDLLAIHLTQINQSDLEILAQKKPNVVHCPESNMKLASGACPIEELRKLNLILALGTDGAASNNDLDMISEMRTAAFLGKLTANSPTAVSALDVLKMATINGAKALGIDHLTGSLSPGKYADFIAIDLGQVETQPVYHPISQIVYASNRQQVSDVWVAGKQVLKNRELCNIDQNELLKKVDFWRTNIAST